MSFAIFADCAANLPTDLASSLDIRILPCTYMMDGALVQYDGNLSNFDYRAYYNALRDGKLVTTSLINTQQFLDAFRPAVEAGQDVVYVGLSSGVSGTVQAAQIAAGELQAEFPDRNVLVVDSMGAGMGIGLLLCRAADLRRAGFSAVQTAAALEQDRLNLCEYFTVGDLMFLRRTGRIRAAAALAGAMLNIKPILWGDYSGHIVACGKVRGRKKAIDAIVAKYAEKARLPEQNRVAISHGDCLEEAEELARRVREIAEPAELIICPHEPFTGAHVGPGMLALFFFGDGR